MYGSELSSSKLCRSSTGDGVIEYEPKVSVGPHDADAPSLDCK